MLEEAPKAVQRSGLYPGAGGTARGVPQEDAWGAGAGGEVGGLQDEGALGEAMEGENMERWEEGRLTAVLLLPGGTLEDGGVAPAFGAPSSHTHTSARASHGFQSYSPK